MRRLSLPLENAFGLKHHSSGTDITHRLLLPRRGSLGGNPARSKATRPINESGAGIRSRPVCVQSSSPPWPHCALPDSLMSPENSPPRSSTPSRAPPGARPPAEARALRFSAPAAVPRAPPPAACRWRVPHVVPGQLARPGRAPHQDLVPLTPVQKPAESCRVTWDF